MRIWKKQSHWSLLFLLPVLLHSSISIAMNTPNINSIDFVWETNDTDMEDTKTSDIFTSPSIPFLFGTSSTPSLTLIHSPNRTPLQDPSPDSFNDNEDLSSFQDLENEEKENLNIGTVDSSFPVNQDKNSSLDFEMIDLTSPSPSSKSAQETRLGGVEQNLAPIPELNLPDLSKQTVLALKLIHAFAAIIDSATVSFPPEDEFPNTLSTWKANTGLNEKNESKWNSLLTDLENKTAFLNLYFRNGSLEKSLTQELLLWMNGKAHLKNNPHLQTVLEQYKTFAGPLGSGVPVAREMVATLLFYGIGTKDSTSRETRIKEVRDQVLALEKENYPSPLAPWMRMRDRLFYYDHLLAYSFIFSHPLPYTYFSSVRPIQTTVHPSQFLTHKQVEGLLKLFQTGFMSYNYSYNLANYFAHIRMFPEAFSIFKSIQMSPRDIYPAWSNEPLAADQTCFSLYKKTLLLPIVKALLGAVESPEEKSTPPHPDQLELAISILKYLNQVDVFEAAMQLGDLYQYGILASNGKRSDINPVLALDYYQRAVDLAQKIKPSEYIDLPPQFMHPTAIVGMLLFKGAPGFYSVDLDKSIEYLTEYLERYMPYQPRDGSNLKPLLALAMAHQARATHNHRHLQLTKDLYQKILSEVTLLKKNEVQRFNLKGFEIQAYLGIYETCLISLPPYEFSQLDVGLNALKRAADLDSTTALTTLGRLYRDGAQVENGVLIKNPTLALSYYKKGADLQDPLAIYLYEILLRDIEKDRSINAP